MEDKRVKVLTSSKPNPICRGHSGTLPKVQRLTPRVWRILGGNPGPYHLQGTNSYLVGTGKQRLLLDTSDPSQRQYLESLEEVLISLGVVICGFVITHHHLDHIGAVNDIHSKLHKYLSVSKVPVSKIRRKEPKDEQHLVPHGYNFVHDGHVFEVEGATLRAVHTPGHTDDHMSVYLEEENALFSGDCILGHSRPVFEDVKQYEASLNKISMLKLTRIYPGHGPVIDNPAFRVQDYLRSIHRREKLLLDCLRQSKTPLKVDEIVNKLYLDISPALKWGAAFTVFSHLKKLVADGIAQDEGHLFAIASKA